MPKNVEILEMLVATRNKLEDAYAKSYRSLAESSDPRLSDMVRNELIHKLRIERKFVDDELVKRIDAEQARLNS